MDIEYSCPLGAKCETAQDDKIIRCRWFVKLRGKDPQTDQDIDEFRCSMEWMPLLQVEHSLFQRQTGAAVESLRNVAADRKQELEAPNFRVLEKTVNDV